MRNLGDKTQLGVSLLQYIRFMGGSFGTALATNTLQSKLAEHYEGISTVQNYFHISIYLHRIKEKLSILMTEPLAEIKSKILLLKVQTLMSGSYAFQDTFRHAGYFGIFGLSFLILLFIPIKNNSSKKQNNLNQL